MFLKLWMLAIASLIMVTFSCHAAPIPSASIVEPRKYSLGMGLGRYKAMATVTDNGLPDHHPIDSFAIRERSRTMTLLREERHLLSYRSSQRSKLTSDTPSPEDPSEDQGHTDPTVVNL